MLNYHDVHGRLPPAVVHGKDGKPLLSWRVLILPYLEQNELYEEFHLGEPWNSPHNSQLLQRMPKSYEVPSGKASQTPPYHTCFRVFVGEGTAFENPEGTQLQSITTGEHNTFLIVQVGEPVPWTKPEGLLYAADKPLPNLDGPFKDGFRAAFADGHVQFIKKAVSEATLRALITGRKPLNYDGHND